MRSHGKWGDFLVALIPLSWCGNILINSNFILRMLEWQNEASLFIVRIQGKQWYWAYKYNFDTNYRLNNLYINVGNNNWVKKNYYNNFFSQDNNILHFIFDYEFKKIHKSNINSKQFNKLNLKNNSLLINTLNDTKFYLNNNKSNKFLNTLNNNKNLKYLINQNKLLINYNKKSFNSNYLTTTNKLKTLKSSYFNKKINNNNNFNLFYKNSNYKTSYYETNKLEDLFVSSENFRFKNTKLPVRLQKGILNNNNLSILNKNNELLNNLFLNYKINKSEITQKQPHFEQFWGFRQKRYKKLRSYVFSQNNTYSNSTYTPMLNFKKNELLQKYFLYNSVKNNKHKNELIPVTLAKRLLRTKRTLILPVHMNITLITNSYDVVHSWFIPGLGLKLDCVPGRSTHHSLYIDSVGFYYGQCAEICGRYHHHMPIRVCALPFEHFMLWWQTKGLPRMYRSEILQKNKSILLNKFNY